MTRKDAENIVGGLSNPSKMPGKAYNLPADDCVSGSKLAKKAGTICSICYARKNRYRFTNVQTALKRRLATLDHPEWVQAMSIAINATARKSLYFRWHDSGDIQSVEHLEKIVEVCRNTARFQHWLPTREYRMVRLFIDGGGVIPDNLTIRFSSVLINGPGPVKAAQAAGVQVSGTSSKKEDVTCHAAANNNECGDCRDCWLKSVFNVTYPAH